MSNKNKFNGSYNKPFVPEKKTDDKKYRKVAIILLLVLAFCCFGSVLAIDLTVKDCTTASADSAETKTFNTQPLPISFSVNAFVFYKNSDGSTGSAPASFSTALNYYTFTFGRDSNNGYTVSMSYMRGASVRTVAGERDSNMSLYFNYFLEDVTPLYQTPSYYTAYEFCKTKIPSGASISSTQYFSVVRINFNSLNFDFEKVVSLTYTYQLYGNTSNKVFFMYKDLNDNYLSIDFSSYTVADKTFSYTLYLDSPGDMYDLGFNSGYSQGAKDILNIMTYGISEATFESCKYVAHLTGGDEVTYDFPPSINGGYLGFDKLANVLPSSFDTSKVELDGIHVKFQNRPFVPFSAWNFFNCPSGAEVQFFAYDENDNLIKFACGVASDGSLYVLDRFLSLDLTRISYYYSFSLVYKQAPFIYSFYQDVYVQMFGRNYATGYNSGYKDGVNDGETIGYNKYYYARYNQGYSEGVKAAGDYTFLSLIGSVVDAPLQAVSGLLNFDLLGFNMLNFFYALVTCALVITVIRLFI